MQRAVTECKDKDKHGTGGQSAITRQDETGDVIIVSVGSWQKEA